MDYEFGDCAIFAVLLAKHTGYGLRALVEYDTSLETTVLIHAFVRKDKDTIIDCTGETSIAHILDKYSWFEEPVEIEISDMELIRLNYGTTEPDWQIAAKDVSRFMAGKTIVCSNTLGLRLD